MSNRQSGIGWHDGALGATPGQLRNGPIVPAAGLASRVLCTALLVGQGVPAFPGVPARFSETAAESPNQPSALLRRTNQKRNWSGG